MKMTMIIKLAPSLIEGVLINFQLLPVYKSSYKVELN
jgi:hypothetical protein